MSYSQPRSSVEIFGHRGVGCSIVGGEAPLPENSIAAFQAAVDLGLDGVELDVWLTKDQQVVVIHGGGSDLEGFLYETVVDVECRLEEEGPKQAAEDYGKIHDQVPSANSIEPSMPLVVDIGGVRRLRRIEEIRYSELRKSGHLQLRRPWSKYKEQKIDGSIESTSSSESTSSGSTYDQSSSSSSSASSADSTYGGSNSSSDASTVLQQIMSSVSATTQQQAVDNNINSQLLSPAPLQPPVVVHLSSIEVADHVVPSTPMVQKVRKLTKVQLDNARLDYIRELVPHVDSDNVVSEVPLLSEVFARFHGRLRFNVELKGSNPLLGQAVLDIAKPFPGIIARISSFLWTTEMLDNDDTTTNKTKLTSPTFSPSSPSESVTSLGFNAPALPTTLKLPSPPIAHPSLSSVANFPNGFVPNDLLAPILYNNLSVPLALLFSGYKLPSMSHMLKCLLKYNAEWIHIPQAFEIDDEEDQRKAAALEEEFVNRKGVLQLLDTFPQSSELTDLHEEHDTVICPRETVLHQFTHLYYLTQVLHQHQHKVLVYGGHANEDASRMELCLLCDIDGLCPNDVASSLLLTKRLKDEGP